MPKFCIYDHQLAVIRKALVNGGKSEIKDAMREIEIAQNYYAIAGISKEDIAGKLFEESLPIIPQSLEEIAERITDDEIEEMAEDMGRSYLENGYWIDVDSLGDAIKDRIENELEEERQSNRSD